MILLVRRQGKIICFFRLESYKQSPVFITVGKNEGKKKQLSEAR